MVFINRKRKLLYLHVTKACGQTIKATLEAKMPNENQPNLPRMVRDTFSGTLFQSLFFHFDARDVQREFPGANEACHTFIGVRNPYDRAYSLHQYCVDKADTYGWNVYFFTLFCLVTAFALTFILPLWLSIPMWVLLLGLTIYLMVANNALAFIRYNTSEFARAMVQLPSLVTSHSSIFGSHLNYCRGLRVDTVLYEDQFPGNFEAMMDSLGIDATVKTTNIGASGHGSLSDVKRQKTMYNGEAYRYLDKHTPETIRLVNNVYSEDFETFGFSRIEPADLAGIVAGRIKGSGGPARIQCLRVTA